MKLSKLALMGAIAGGMYAGTAWAEVRQPARVQRTAFESYYAQDDSAPSPSDKASASEPAEPAAAPAAGCDNGGCDGTCNACDTCGCADDCCGHEFGTLGGLIDPCCKLGEPCKLFDDECLKCRGINIGGWITQSYYWNTSDPVDRFNGIVTTTDRANEYQFNQGYIFVEKATDASTCCWDFGYRMDAIYGSDSRFTTASGLETRSQFQSPKWSTYRFYGPAAPQFYVEAARNDLKIKVGHFYAPVGYEVFTTNLNFFSSLPLTFQYGEPFTFTGGIATKKFSDKVTAGIGVVQGWDNFDNSTPNPGLVDTYTRTYDDKSSLAIAQVYSQEPTQAGTFRGRFLQTTVFSKPLDDKWTYVIQSDLGYQNDAIAASGKDAWWYGLNQYLFYKVSDCFSWGVRGEWFRDEEGYRVGGFLGTTPDGSTRGLSTNRAGYIGNFYEVTFGANWKPSANINFRPGVRFDWFDGTSTNPSGDPTNPNKPFDGGFGNSQTLLGFDVVMTY